jgi:collagenase-like PrtC family protease
MSISNRRNFLIKMLRGTGITLLCLFPGSVFRQNKLFAQKERDFEAIFKSTTRSNVYNIAKASSLSDEEKMAMVAARELSRSELKEAISNIGSWGKVESGGGCGSNCSGQFCGQQCGGETGGDEQQGICVIDKRGRMEISMASLDKDKFKQALEMAIDLVR